MGRADRILRFSALLGMAGGILLAQHGSHSGVQGAPITAPPQLMPPAQRIPSYTASSPFVSKTVVPARAPAFPTASAYINNPAGNPVYNRQPNYAPLRGHPGRGRNNYGVGYGYLAAPYYPFWDFSNDYAYSGAPDYSAAYQQPAPPMQDDTGLGQQIAALSEQVSDLQNQMGQNQLGPNQPQQAPSQESDAPPAPPITLVLTNGQTLRVQNYAVMDNIVWDLSSQPVRKIPFSSIDVQASTRATEAGGAEFPQLNSRAKSSAQ